MIISSLRRLVFPLLLLAGGAAAQAQSWNLVWREDFGVAEDSVIKDFPDPTMTVPNHAFYEDKRVCIRQEQDPVTYQMICLEYGSEKGGQGPCGTIDDGYYGITNSSWWAYNRPKTEGCGNGAGHFVPGRDHTGNKNGAMLVVNTGTGVGEIIYKQDVKFDLCDARKYRFVAYAANVTAYEDAVLANLTLRVINTKTGELVGEIETGDIPSWVAKDYSDSDPKAEREWQEYSLEFTANDGDQLSLQVTNNSKGGMGNDFVIDDISLYRYDDETVPEPEISATSVSQAGAADACSYVAKFSVPQQVLTDWKKIYDQVYFLWQQSTDEGLTWQNVTSVSGIDKTEVEIELDKSKNTIFRVIITGGSTTALAEEQALYIAKNGGPKGGCAYYSISNTLSSKPAADCTYSDDLLAVFSDDFGSVPGGGAVENAHALYSFVEKGLQAGDYCVTSNTKNTEQNSWDGIPDFTDHTGNADGGMLFCRTNKDHGTIYEKWVDGPFCKCKSYIFSFYAAALGSWSTLHLTGQVLDKSGNEIASLPISEGNNGKDGAWKQYQFSFSPNEGDDALLLKIFATDPSTEAWGTQVVIDDISLRICGVRIPQDSIYIDNDPLKTSLLDFDCSETPGHTINLSSMSGWTKDYPNAVAVWQKSTDGGLTWQTMTETGNSIDFDTDEGGTISYRAIIAEDATTAANVAAGGKGDKCGIYLITNTVTLGCTAQCHFSEDMLVLWKDDFGSVPSGTRKQCAYLKGHSFLKDMKKNVDDGQYAVVSRMEDAGNWFAAMDGTDHTGNADGGFLVINIDKNYKDKVVYEQELGFTTCPGSSYFFSLWASSISKRVANGDKTGVLCNLTLEIVDAATGDVLASVETGDIPSASSLKGQIPWKNYGVSFTSAGEKVILRIYDHAGNGDKGNDLALDDISLIACEEEAPVVELAVDGEADVTGICGVDTYTLKVGDLTGWNKIYGNDVYCLWQRSADGGETWENMDANSGLATDFGQLEVTALRNEQLVNDSLVNVGFRYRVIVAGPESDVTKQIAKQGYPNDGCYLYRISNDMTVRCECEAPELEIDGDDVLNICKSDDEVQLKVVQKNTAVIDAVSWFSKAQEETDWTLAMKFEGADVSAASLVFSTVPTDSVQYLCIAYSEKCVSDSMVFTLNVDKPIVLEELASTTLCVGSDTTYSAVATSGYPLTYVWNGVEGKDETFELTSIAADKEVKLVAKGAACVSEEMTASVKAEKEVQIAVSLSDVEVCALAETTFNSQAVAQNIQWYYTDTKTGLFKEIAGATESVLTCSPDSSRTYKVVASGDKCAAKELTVGVTVNYPATIDASIDEKAYCKGGSSVITVTLNHVTSLQWMAKKEGETAFSLVETTTHADTETSTSMTFTPEVSTEYMVKVPSNDCAAAQSDVMAVTVEQPIDFALTVSDEAVCQATEVTLTLTMNGGSPATQTLTSSVGDAVDASALWTDGTMAVTPTATTTYTATLAGTLCQTAVTKTVDVKVEVPTSLSALIAEEKICVGEDAGLQFTATPTNAAVNIMKSTDGVNFVKVATLEKPTATTWYKVQSEAGDVCDRAETNVVKVEVEDSIRFTLKTPAEKICEGTPVKSAIQLQTGTAASMAWTKNGVALATDAAMTDLPTDESNLYEATATGSACPAVTKSFSVEVEKQAVLEDFSASAKKICINDEVTLSVKKTNADVLVWETREPGGVFSPANGVVAPDEEQTIRPTATAEYRVSTTGADVCNNVSSAMIRVEVEDSVSVTLPADTVVCPGTSVELVATIAGNPAKLVWEQNDGAGYTALSNKQNTLRIKPAGTASYRLTADADVCPKSEAEVTVSVEEVPELTIAASGDSLCQGDLVELNTTFVNDTSIVWKSKFENGNLYADMLKGASSYSEMPEKTSYYMATARTEHGCPAQSEAVKVLVSERIEVMASDTFVCEGGKTQLKAYGLGGYTYSWYADAAHTQLLGNEKKLDVEPASTSNYYLVVANASCKEEKTVEVEVLTNPYISSLEDRAAREIEVMADGGNGGLQYNYGKGWTTDNLFTDFLFGTEYTIKVMDAKGCLADTTFTTDTYDIKVPQVMTPNGDGVNDMFEIVNLSKYPVSVIRIYDRHGKKLLEQKGADFGGWDGTYLGAPMPSTDYWYEIWVEELAKYYTGHFTLMRK